MKTAVVAPGAVRPRRDPAAPWRHVDPILAAATVAIAVLGLVMIYSATRQKLSAAGGDPHQYLTRQALYLVLGLVAMVVVAVVDYRVLRDATPVIYVGTVAVLVLVLSGLGTSSRGAQAWFPLGSFRLEPSELAKPAFILCLSAYCATHRGDLDTSRIVSLLALAAVPMGLIWLQPDLGTDLVFAAIMMAILLVAGARPRALAVLTLLGVTGAVALLQLGVMKQYQLDRLGAFLDPRSDVQQRGYNQHQSKVAIAAGGLAGQGLFRGSQTNLSFVPEQHTDFIFTALGEELGFVGAVTLLALFAVVVWRTWRTAVLARDLFGTLVCVGVLAMLVFQIFQNVGMTMGIMPITGIPLPFMSYGGSATLGSFAAIGLVLNVHMRRFS